MAKTSQYKGVSKCKGFSKDSKPFRTSYFNKLTGLGFNTYHTTEREAAIAYDKKMIELGKEPVNILKRK